MKKSLSDRFNLGTLELKNRVVMAAMTRMRTDPTTGIPNSLMANYYSQRANAGLIFTESAAVSRRGEGFPGAGNIYTKEQADGWKKVIEAVKKKDGNIFIQISHAGQKTHSYVTGGLDLWASSAVAAIGRVPGKQIEYGTPK